MKTLLIFLLVLVACGPKNADVIGEAQLCLDRANSPGDAQACVEPLKDINTRNAQNLKCSAGFISEGFKDGQKIVQAYQYLSSPSEGTLTFLGMMTFSSKATPPENRHYAREIDSYCEAGGQPVYSMMSAISLAATTLSAAGRLQWNPQKLPTKEELRTAIIALKATRSEPASIQAVREVGSALLKVYERSCYQSKMRPTRLCQQIDSALKVGGRDKDTENTADRLLELWLQ